MLPRQLTHRRLLHLIGFALLLGFAFQCQRAYMAREERVARANGAASAPVRVPSNAAFAAIRPEPIDPTVSWEDLARTDPEKFFGAALERYDRTVRDYTCTFARQECIAGKIGDEEVVSVMFREKPYSVRMEWTKNQDKCARVLYVANRWIKDGAELAVIEPGAIARMFVPYVMRPIHGKDALKSSRKTIDQFGVRNALFLTLKFVEMAREQKADYSFAYLGRGKVDDRPTFMFERRLPFDAASDTWPDRVLVVHVDSELLLPVLVEAYGDNGREHLLGRYHTSDLKLNPNLSDETFTKQGMGL